MYTDDPDFDEKVILSLHGPWISINDLRRNWYLCYGKNRPKVIKRFKRIDHLSERRAKNCLVAHDTSETVRVTSIWNRMIDY